MTSIDRLTEEVGDLIARHDRGKSLVTFRKYADDPVGFIREVLGGEPIPAQEEIAETVLDNPLVAVRTGNAFGKDKVSAWLSLWYAYSRGGLVLLTGPTQRQVKHILFGEVRQAWEKADGLPGELFEMALRLNRSEPSGILGYTSTETGRRQGFHAPSLLQVITEAQECGEGVFEAAYANAMGDESRILVCGNPTTKACRFYNCFQEAGGRWVGLHYSSFDHPNVKSGEELIPGAVTRSGIERLREEFGENSARFQARVLGEFPESEESALTNWADVEKAQAKHEEGTLHDKAREKGFVIGLDVGHEGEDLTVAAIRQGPVVRRLVTWRRATTSETVRKVKQLVTSLVAGRSERLERGVDVVVDSAGVGAGVHDDLAELDLRYLRVHKFKAAFSAEEPDLYYQLRDECYWKLRNLLRKGRIALPRDPELAEELTEMRWENGPRDTIKMESKSGSGGLTSRLGRSPDRADAVSMSLTRDAGVAGVHLWGGYDDDAPAGWHLLGPPVASGRIPAH